MNRTLHWTLLSGCAALISLFTPLAWNSLQVFRLSDGAFEFGGQHQQAALEESERQEFALSEANAGLQPSRAPR